MPQKPNLRERNKIEKLSRIQAAVRKLFTSKGFDATTTRQIAQEADVGLATLFLYATDKRDLLFLLYNDGLDELTTYAFAQCAADQPLLTNLEKALLCFFEFYGQDKTLSKDVTREITFYTTGKNSARFQAIRERTTLCITELVVQARRCGEINAPETDSFIGRNIFDLYAAAIRRWLSQDSDDPQVGLQDLMQCIKLLMHGLH